MNDNDLYQQSFSAREAGQPAELDLEGMPNPNSAVKALFKRLERDGFLGEVTVKYEAGQAFQVRVKDYPSSLPRTSGSLRRTVFNKAGTPVLRPNFWGSPRERPTYQQILRAIRLSQE